MTFVVNCDQDFSAADLVQLEVDLAACWAWCRRPGLTEAENPVRFSLIRYFFGQRG